MWYIGFRDEKEWINYAMTKRRKRNRKLKKTDIFRLSASQLFSILGSVTAVFTLSFSRNAKILWLAIFIAASLLCVAVFLIYKIRKQKVSWKNNNLLIPPTCFIIISSVYLLGLQAYELYQNRIRENRERKAINSKLVNMYLFDKKDFNLDRLIRDSKILKEYNTYVGYRYFETGQFFQAQKWFALNADFDPDAAFRLGICNLLGLGGPINSNKGIQLLKQAAEKEHFEAQEALVEAYLAGRNTDADLEKALYWSERLLLHNTGYSLIAKLRQENRLAILYLQLNEYKLAYKYCKKHLGKPGESYYFIPYVISCMCIGKIDEAIEYAQKAYDKGNEFGGILLGTIYQENGSKENLIKAEKILLELAISKKNIDAAKDLVKIYESHNFINAANYWKEVIQIDMLFESK